MEDPSFNLQPLQKLLEKEIELNDLIAHLDIAYYRFAECALKASKLDGQPVDDEVITSCYWIERIKQAFEEMRIRT